MASAIARYAFGALFGALALSLLFIAVWSAKYEPPSAYYD
jgi:hypothetical protein